MKDNTIVFLLLEYGKYKTITYAEYKEYCDINPEYKSKKLVPFKAGLLEMSPDDYTAYYKDKRRIKYLREQDEKHLLTSLDSLDAEKLSNSELLGSTKHLVEDKVIQSFLIEQLLEKITFLKEDDQKLVVAHYFDDISETELADQYGISQQAISKRLLKIKEKLKKYLKL